jgi:hypothetical protein
MLIGRSKVCPQEVRIELINKTLDYCMHQDDQTPRKDAQFKTS